MKNRFNLSEKYNYEKEVSLSIELDKICYSKGELLTGTLILTPKENSTITELANPYTKFSFLEKQCYEFIDKFHEKDNDILKPTRKNIKEINPLGTLPMDFSNYANAKMVPCLKIPFKINVPNNAYPSCIFDEMSYVIHFLICEIESLQVKKSTMIIIKNNYYFSKENKLLKIPTEYNKIIHKHKLAVISCGFFVVKVTLPRNICPYNKNLPITIEIDCSKLTVIKIKGVKIYIFKNYRKNTQKNKNLMKEEKTEEIVSKTIPLTEGLIGYKVEDEIKLPLSSKDPNPEEVYKLLDKAKNQGNQNFDNIKLFPSCTGGLLSCQYYIKIIIETNTLFSTNEEIIIPIDFYSPFNNNDDMGGSSNYINNKENMIKEENKNENLKNEGDVDGNLNINQQVFMSGNNEIKSEQEIKQDENKNINNNSKNTQLFPDDDD